MILELVLLPVIIGLLIWGIFRLAVVALPLWLGVIVFVWTQAQELDVSLGILLGLVVGASALVAGQLVVQSRMSVLVRGSIALLYAVPAGIAGNSIASGLMNLGDAGSLSVAVFGVIGGLIVAIAAVRRLLLPAATPRLPRRNMTHSL